MERHIGKRLGIPCAVISAPVHVQDFPARYSPVMGFEGANVLFDTWVHPLVMGLEEHLLTMFREDFEFHDAAGASHHGGHAPKAVAEDAGVALVESAGGQPAAVGSRTGGEPTTAPQSISGTVKQEDAASVPVTGEVIWLADAERELRKIPFFVRGKAKRNTEKYAAERGIAAIAVETLYEAKAHYAR
jgi:light-independent protochlorophyllide reductase subunit B